MKVIGISSSYHSGSNSGIFVDCILEGAKEAGASIESLYLINLNVKPCTGCNICKSEGKITCAQKDDFEKIISSIKEADVVVFGSPVYFGRVNAPFLNFVDRLYSQMNPDFSSRLPAGKKFAVVLTSGSGGEETTGPIVEDLKRVFGMFFGWEYTGLFAKNQLYAPREAEGRVAEVAEARAFGKKLVMGN